MDREENASTTSQFSSVAQSRLTLCDPVDCIHSKSFQVTNSHQSENKSNNRKPATSPRAYCVPDTVVSCHKHSRISQQKFRTRAYFLSSMYKEMETKRFTNLLKNHVVLHIVLSYSLPTSSVLCVTVSIPPRQIN